MARPSVDIVVPFAGTDEQRRRALAAMRAIALAPGDTLTLVDNGPAPPPAEPGVLHAPRIPTSYHARNAGAARGAAPWIVFLDADVTPPADLLDRYFGEPVADEVGVLAGGIADEAAGTTLAARYAARRAAMSDAVTADRGPWAYAQTANAAVRRAAFDQVGGFEEHTRSGGDADLCFRLRDAGWALAQRPGARVTHRNRTTLRALVRQRARHGSGAAWLERRHPGAIPPSHPLGSTRAALRAAMRAVRSGRHEEAAFALVDALLAWAFAIGQFAPNNRRGRG